VWRGSGGGAAVDQGEGREGKSKFAWPAVHKSAGIILNSLSFRLLERRREKLWALTTTMNAI
jgi:hypothetical protein